MKLIWNELECAWECSECGALYSKEEVERVFGYNTQVPERFTESYCMDCGCQWNEAVM